MVRGIVEADEGDEIFQFLQAVDVANRALVDDAVVTLGVNPIAHVVADRRPVLLQVEVIAHVHVGRLQHIHRPGVGAAHPIVLLALIFDHLLDVGASRQPLRGERAAHQHLVGMDDEPAVGVLVIEAGSAQPGPRLLQSQRLHALQDAVRHSGAAVERPLALPLRCVLDQQLARQNARLGEYCRRRHQDRGNFESAK